MTTQTFDGYYVFEADQVLTNDHLNQEFYYLDWQERLTRNKLIGTGIVCGLDITSAGGKIGISKGSGVTSEGYLIVLESPVTYDYFVQYTGLTQPADLPFTPDLPTGYALPFYSAYCAPPAPAIYQLLDSTQYTTQNPMPAGSAALTTLTLSNYAVVLFVEMNEKDLKNCDTQDCNNKGEKMAITIQALLVPISSLPNPFTTAKAKEIKLARYNVPYAPIKTAADVLTSFYNILNNGVLTNLAASYAWCYDRYSGVLTDTQNPFSNPGFSLAQQLSTALTNLWNNTNRITVQYLYDYVNDLILAYYEFRETAAGALLTQCVGHELDFPLHVVLGAANNSSGDMTADPYRTYFIYSAIFDAQNHGVSRTQFMFNRMKMLVTSFDVQTYTETTAIKITPSQYMEFPLSERCIPFYYNPASVNGTAPNQVWNYNKALNNNDDFILGYNSSTYNSDDSVVSPLLYDIEQYNFFRIEGHIGQQYADVLSYLLNQQLTYNLPFDIVAISAELLSTANSTAIPECSITDLDSEFRLLVTEFLTKLFLCIYKFTIVPYQYGNILATEGTFGLANLQEIDNEQFITNFNLEFSSYQYGDFYARYAPFASIPFQTIGSAYVQAVQNGAIQNGTFNSPVNLFNGSNLSYMQGYNSLFQMLYTVDNLFYMLLNTDLKDMNSASFSSAYEQYDKLFDGFTTVNGQETTAFANSCACECLVTIIERVLVLLAEYQSRLNNYLAQLSFMNYYTNHPGLEHKSGVPKGGTFVLVYHEGPEWMYYDQTVARSQALTTTTASDVTVTTNAPTGTKPAETLSVGNSNLEYTLNTDQINNIWALMEQCNDAPPATKQKIIGFLPLRPRPIQQQFPEIDNGAIIADFYIPYQCCSDCAPIAYMINNKVNVYTVSGGGSACAGNTNNNTGISAVLLSGTDVDVIYNLYNSSDPTFKITITGDGNPHNFGVQAAAGTYTVTAVSADGNTKVNMNGSAVVMLNTPPTQFNVKTLNNVTSYCAGTAGVDIYLDGFQSGVQYQLYNGTTADPAGPVTPSTGTIVDFGMKPTGTYTVSAKNPTTGCTNNMIGSVTITAGTPPAAQTVNGGGSFCANDPGTGIVVGLADSENGVSYQLFVTVPGGTATTAGGPVNSTGGAFNFPPQMVAGIYSVVATNAAGCKTNMSNTVPITALPVPSSNIKTPPAASLNVNKSVLTVTLTAVETDLNYTFKWVAGGPAFDTYGIAPDQQQPAKNTLIFTIPIQLINEIMDKTKRKGANFLVSLRVNNSNCFAEGTPLDLWPTLAQYATNQG